jgi:hypothetical protein
MRHNCKRLRCSKALKEFFHTTGHWRNLELNGLELTVNLDYTRRSRGSNGLGLDDIDPNSPGLILLGRREPEVATKDRRRQYGRELNIRIHSIDWLFNNGEALNFHDAG